MIHYQSRSLERSPEETVLQCLRRHGIVVPSSCEAGACQSCLMRVVEGEPPAQAQLGLKDGLRLQGYFLACQARPEQDLCVVLPDADAVQVPATVTAIDSLSADVARVRLKVDSGFECRGGQFLSLVRGDGLVRPYSIANLPDEDGALELHVRRTPGGAMSGWIHDQLRAGDRLHIRGPAGDCFYVAGEPAAPLLLVGTGTGLAPLHAILRDALRHGHHGPIVLMHGALGMDGFYLVEELAELASRHGRLTYLRCLPEGDAADGVTIGPIDALVRQHLSNPADWRIYLCGNPALVYDLRKKVFLAGASMKRIHSDAFLSAPR